MENLIILIKEFYVFAKKNLNLNQNCKIILKNDSQNAQNMLGQTGYYNPNNDTIVVYVTKRHPKDILRSIAHEMIHFYQKCNGKFDNIIVDDDPQYAQNNDYLRKMEKEAYEKGNLLFRDWEDNKKYKKIDNEEKFDMFEKRNEQLFKENMKKICKINIKEEKENEFDEKQLEIGTEIEKEHKKTVEFMKNNPDVAEDEIFRKIAEDHLSEFSNYYDELVKMEKELKEKEKSGE